MMRFTCIVLLLAAGSAARGDLAGGGPEAPLRVAPDAWTQLARARRLLDAGDTDGAFAGYQVVLDAFDDVAPRNAALAGQARARFGQGRFAEAARLFQHAADGAEETPKWRVEWLSRAADAVFASGRHAEAARMYRQVYTLFPGDALAGEMLLRAADALVRGGDAQGALEAFAHAAEADPALAAEAHARQGEIMAWRGEVAACAALVGPLLEPGGDAALRGRAFLALGRAHFAAGAPGEALAAFGGAMETEGTAREAAWLCVPVLHALGRGDDARAAAGRCLADAGSPFAQEARFWLLRHAYNGGRFGEAAALAEAFSAASPQDARAGAALAWSARAAALSGDFNRAVDAVSRLRRMSPADDALSGGIFTQGVALLGLGRFQEAALVFDDLVTRHPESAWTTRAWLRKGDALYLLGAGRDAFFNDAAAAYEEALLRYDITPAARVEALYKTGRCLERLGRAADALEIHAGGVAAPFLASWRDGPPAAAGGEEWFSRAVFRAADIWVSRGEPAAARQLLGRVAALGVPGAAEAVERMRKGD